MTPSRYLGVALALVALALPAGAAGAEPTLGGRLSPVPMTYEVDPRLNITNLSTVPVRASLEIEGPGWVLEADAFALAVGERRTIAVVAAGQDDAVLSVVLTPELPTGGADANVLVLQGKLRHAGPWEGVPVLPLGAILAALGFLGALWAVRRRLRVTVPA